MGNLVSSCGPQGPTSTNSSPKANNTTKTNGKTNTPPPSPSPSPSPAPSPSPSPAPSPSPSPAPTKPNNTKKINTPKGVRISNIEEVSNISNVNAKLAKKAPPKTTAPTESILKTRVPNPNIQTKNPKAIHVLNKSIRNALRPSKLKGPVAKGMTEETTPENKALLREPDDENAENEKLLSEMTNPPPNRPAGLAGGRRTRKQRKHRKH